ncbi:NYN domain-containing protein [Ruegeria arenilitoris]|uniref:NYN domain-containing protein n=1 Tax=Ruegeria arenilitoris TaxID=1173585 RepID=UPI0014808962|nr:NYN domain-containing protein [Ruegeria arenilitoris]
MTTEATERLAVLIDADNVPAKYVAEIFEEVAILGEANMRRIYGNFSGEMPQGWSVEILAKHAIIPQLQLPNTTRKNAGDIALVIDAMDILHSGRFNGFVLVSSDSDFTRLAIRVREQGLKVFGIGEKKSPKAFVQACNRFIYIENIKKGDLGSGEKAKRVQPEKDVDDAFKLIRKVVLKSEEPDGWAGLGWVGSQLRMNNTDFDVRAYGSKRLSDLVRATGKFEETGENGGLKIRLKDQ